MPHIPLAIWYFRSSAPHLIEYMDLVNHNFCVEMTITIDHCQWSYRIRHSNLWVRVSYNKHSLNSTSKEQNNIKNRNDPSNCIKARKVTYKRRLHKCLSFQWARLCFCAQIWVHRAVTAGRWHIHVFLISL